MLGGGDFVAAFADRPEVRAFQEYLATADWANERAKLGNWISANRGLDVANVTNPLDKRSVEILQDPAAVFRFELRPDARGGGGAVLLEGNDGLDAGQVHQGHAALHRDVLTAR